MYHKIVYISDCESVLFSQYAMMLKRHLREQEENQKFFEHTSKQLKRQDMNDVKSLHTLRTKNKNKKVFMPIV